jgi:hypothetical protein
MFQERAYVATLLMMMLECLKQFYIVKSETQDYLNQVLLD